MELIELFEKAKKGNPPAQSQLYEMLEDKMLAVCRRYAKTTEDAEECLQEGFYHVFTQLPTQSWKDEQTFRKWVRKIMARKSSNYMRGRKDLKTVPLTDLEEIPLQEEVYSGFATKDMLEAVTYLPDALRAVFNMHQVEGFSHAEIAELLDTTEQNSWVLLHRAKLALQKIITVKENSHGQQASK